MDLRVVRTGISPAASIVIISASCIRSLSTKKTYPDSIEITSFGSDEPGTSRSSSRHALQVGLICWILNFVCPLDQKVVSNIFFPSLVILIIQCPPFRNLFKTQDEFWISENQPFPVLVPLLQTGFVLPCCQIY